jgi:hypothetical protein
VSVFGGSSAAAAASQPQAKVAIASPATVRLMVGIFY